MKFRSIRIPLSICSIVGALVCLLAVLSRYLSDFEIFQRLECITFDWRVRQAAAKSPSIATNLGFVYVRDESIEALLRGALDYRVGLYWPRHVYGRLVQELNAQGAGAIAFDVLFGELRPDHDQLTVRLPDGSEEGSDKFFARSLRSAGNVILAAEKGVLPAPLFRTNALAIGDIGAKPDSDGILRRARAYDDFYVWHRLIKDAERQEGFDLRQARFESNRLVIPFPNGSLKTIPLEKGLFD